ncbi:hypothetical protein [Castellaniella sp.]|uniref:hypothetical protein n=1 Tax=Castellaniella sp. TaxID=1955812 RepID=UPI002AFE0EB6|nr:hypothetical protein [Castellaniella sp.]
MSHSYRRVAPHRRPADTHRLTEKQYQIMSTIVDGTHDAAGNPCALDMEQLLDRLPYRTTRESMQFSLRKLEGRGLITRDYEKRRGRCRALVYPTKLGLTALTNQFSPRPSTAVAEIKLELDLG